MIEEKTAETNIGFGVAVAAGFDGFAEGAFCFGGIAEGEVGHTELVRGFEIGRSHGEGLLKIGDSGLGILVLVKSFLAGGKEFAGFGGHGKFVDRNGRAWQGLLLIRKRLKINSEAIAVVEC